MQQRIMFFEKLVFKIFQKKKPKKFGKYVNKARKLDKQLLHLIIYLKRNHKKIILYSIILVGCLVLLTKNWNWLDISLINEKEIDNILKILISASSIIVSIIIGFMVTKFFDIKKFRLDMLNKFISLQSKLNEYQNAFYWFADQLSRKYPIDPKYPTDYRKLKADLKFWENYEENKPYGSLFVRSLREFGLHHWEFRNYEIDNKIMNKEYLLLINEAITQVNGTLTRYKHYKHVLSDFGLPQRQDLSLSNVADESLGVKYHAMRISPENEKNDWKNLEFWYDRVIEATDITEKMINLLPFIHDYKAKTIKIPMIFLMFASVFGIIIPLLLLSLVINNQFEYFLTYSSITGFLLCFIVLIRILYKEVTSKTILSI
ncbi:MAG: hypothetical protein KAI55_03075 [Candidatus Aenigmarchaeota archaeon]|nr:hypothetical protein [Candidatus Aenigmarchaeota archaeon]